LPAANQTDGLPFELKRVSTPNFFRHPETSKTDYNKSALGDVFWGQGHFVRHAKAQRVVEQYRDLSGSRRDGLCFADAGG
jgi:hypothetical protein